MKKPGGIYIHIPFCIRKCPYCNFYSVTDLSYADIFIDALVKEIKGRADETFICDTIYFGGGTPSLLTPHAVSEIISAICESFKVTSKPEITIEANPGTVTKESLVELKNAKVSRLVIGLQSFSDIVLNFLGRIHTAKEAISAYESAKKAGFENIGLDLIYGASCQNEKMWINDLEKTVALSPEHISCYMLTFEPDTIMEKRLESGMVKEQNETIQSEMFLSTIDFLEKFGYLQYEISNFSKKNFHSRHNVKYWSNVCYKGFGPSAHSFDKESRYWNISDINKYIKRLLQGKKVIEKREWLAKEEKITEFIYLRLRTIAGIDMKKFYSKFGFDFAGHYNDIIEKFQKNRLIEIKNDFCRLTRKGMLLSDGIAASFL